MKNTVQAYQINTTNHLVTSANKHRYWHWLAPFVCLLIIEVITFGINAKNVGVYQDEWITLTQLHFAPHSLSKLISICFWDPRIIVRPIEALHFAPLFYLVKENPLWYHITCYISEFVGAWFLFLALSRFTGKRTIAFVAALLYLLYPTHDVTHYEIVASSLPISMAFYTASLWLYLKGLDNNSFSLINLSALAYFISIYNYELCLPFFALYPLLYLLRKSRNLFTERNQIDWAGLRTFITFQIPSFTILLSMLIYRRWLLPSFSLGYYYTIIFDLSNFISVIWSGWIVSFSTHTLMFSASMLSRYLTQSFSILSIILMLLASCSVFFCLLTESKTDKSNNHQYDSNLLYLAIFGAVAITLSYTIYGLSPEHKPVIDTWLNRVNLGGALGASIMIAALVGLLQDRLSLITKPATQIIFAAIVSIFASALILINWQFAKPWIVSWTAQKELMNILKSHSSEIASGDSIIIGDIIRYASKWTPVVDGVWDFQGIVRTTLNNEKLYGTVVTERLTLTKDSVKDQYGNIVLGEFPFKQMILCDPLKKCWIRISSRTEFIEQANRLGWNIPENPAIN